MLSRATLYPEHEQFSGSAMAVGLQLVRVGCVVLSVCACLQPQVTVAGRVVDETGAGIEGARVEFRPASGGNPVPASSDPAGNFRANLAAEGEDAIPTDRKSKRPN